MAARYAKTHEACAGKAHCVGPLYARFVRGIIGKTIFLSSHILLEVAKIYGKPELHTIGIIEAGRLVTCGTLGEIQREEQRRRNIRQIRAVLTGHAEEAVVLLQAAPNVIEVTITKQAPRRCELLVSFSGDDIAQTKILTRLMQAGLPVIGFQELVGTGLEDVFMQVTKGIVA